MANNIVLHASQSRVSVDNWDIKTGEYNIQDCSVVFEEDLKEALTDQYKWFAVFKYDKREYESEIDLDVNSENKPFDMPVFSKPGYVNVGVYGYEYAIGTINKEQVAEKVAGINTYTGHPVNWCMSDFDLTDDFKGTYGDFIDTVKFDAFTNKYTLTFKTIIVGGAERELPAGTKITVKYKYRPLNPETGDPIMRLRYSPSMQLCEVKNGSSPVQPIPSPGTYAKLNQRIDELGEGIHDTETMRNWWHNFTQNQEVLNLREVFNTMTESGSYVASYKNIYDIIEDYFGEGKTIGRPVGDKLFEISYFKINLIWSNNAWISDKKYTEIIAAIKEGKLPIIHYVTDEDNNYAIYSNHSDDGIVFSGTKTIIQEGSTEHQIKLINFTIYEDGSVTKEEVIINDIIASQFEKVDNKQDAIDESRKSQLYYATENAIVTYVLSKLPDVSIYEIKENKKSVIDSESIDYYPNFKAVKGYAEALANRVTSLLNADDNHYPTAKAVTDYAEPATNKEHSVSSDNTKFPTSKAVQDYAEAKANKDTQMTVPDDTHYPTTKAVETFGNNNYTYRFNSGRLERTEEGEGQESSNPLTETVYIAATGFSGNAKCKLSKDFISTTTPGHYPKVTSPATGVTIAEGQPFTNGEFYINISPAVEQETPVIVEYYFLDKHYEYKLHFYRDGVEVPSDKITPIDLTQLRGGGGGSGGISFDEVRVVTEDEIQKLKFYYMGSPLQVTDGSLAKVQLASATESTESGVTKITLKDKLNNDLTSFTLDAPLTETQITELEKLI